MTVLLFTSFILAMLSSVSVIIIAVVICLKLRTIAVYIFIIAYTGLFVTLLFSFLANGKVCDMFSVDRTAHFVLCRSFYTLRSFLIFLFPLFGNYILAVSRKKAVNIFFGILSGISVFLILFLPNIDFANFFSVAGFFISIICIVIMLFRSKIREFYPKIWVLQIVYMSVLTFYFVLMFFQFVLLWKGVRQSLFIDEASIISIALFFFNVFFLVFLSHYLEVKQIPAPGIELKMDNISSRYKLTNREQEIIRFLLFGFSVYSIAEKTFTSPLTVRTHIRNIYTKMNITSRIQLYNLLSHTKDKEQSVIPR